MISFLVLIVYIVFFSLGMFMSKKYIVTPNIYNFLWVNFWFFLCNISWLLTLSNFPKLSKIGAICNILCLLCGIFMGVYIFNEKITTHQFLGIVFGIIAIILIGIGK